MDDNLDRKLNLEEMAEGLQEFGADMDEDQVAELFNEIDKDGSGTVRLDEFLRAVRVSDNNNLNHKSEVVPHF